MEFLRRLFLSTRDQLGGLTLSQRMSIGLFVIIVAGSLVWLTQWAGEPEMVALFTEPLTVEQAAAVQAQLDRVGARSEIASDGRLMVPAARKARLYMMLAENQALPDDATLSFADVMNNASPFETQDAAQWARNLALQAEVARMITMFRGVRSARVLIDPTTKRGLGKNRTRPSATVQIETKRGTQVDADFVRAIAETVAGVNASLTPDRVIVVDSTTGRSFSVPDPDDPAAVDELARRVAYEKRYQEQISRQLAYIPGVIVSVRATLVTEQITTKTQTFSGEPSITSETITENTDTTVTQQTGPGAVANISTAVGGATPTRQNEESTTKREFATERDSIETVSINRILVPESMTAAVSIPREYFVEIYKRQPGAVDPPDAAALTLLIDTKVEAIGKQVQQIIGGSAADIDVDVYEGGNFVGVNGADGESAVSATASVVGYVRNYGSQAGLGALAVISLVMMLMVVRKASEGMPVTESAFPMSEGEEEVDVLATDSAPIGEAAATGGLLMGHEIDEGTLRTREIVEQLGKMVTDDPETAAHLVQRWVDREK